jgi:hypothetical protein
MEPSTSPESAPGGSAPGADAGRTAPGTLPTRDELVEAWGDTLLTRLPSRARARFRVGRFLAVEDATAVFALPNETHRSYCEEVRHDVEQVLAGHFGAPVPMRLVVDEDAEPDSAGAVRRTGAAPAGEEGASDDDSALLDPDVLEAETEPAGAGPSAEQRLKQMFPGAEEL